MRAVEREAEASHAVAASTGGQDSGAVQPLLRAADRGGTFTLVDLEGTHHGSSADPASAQFGHPLVELPRHAAATAYLHERDGDPATAARLYAGLFALQAKAYS